MPRRPRRKKSKPSASPRYVTLAAVESIVSLDAGENENKLPERFRVFPWGTVKTGKGPVTLDAAAAASIREANRIESGDTVALDFEHNTVKGHPNYKGEPTKIAAHCRMEIVDNDGLYFVPANWTDDGEEFIGGRHYKDASLAAKLDATGRIRRVLSAAACREGEVEEIHIFSRSEKDFPEKKETQNDMDNNELVEALREALGLEESAEPSAIMDALTKKLNEQGVKAKKPEGGDVTMSVDLGNDEQVTALRKALGLDALSEQLTTLSKQSNDDAREVVLSRATREGKVVPESLRDLDPGKLDKVVDELPVTVPVEERGGDVTLSRTLNEPAGYDEGMASQLGLSKEDFDANKDD